MSSVEYLSRDQLSDLRADITLGDQLAVVTRHGEDASGTLITAAALHRVAQRKGLAPKLEKGTGTPEYDAALETFLDRIRLEDVEAVIADAVSDPTAAAG